MEAIIKGISIISPQRIIGEQAFPDEIINHSGTGYMKCIEPIYREFIDPMVARRMSRIVKMGVYCAMKCMKETGISMPDAIIAGTGLGCLEDTEKFLSSIYTNEEKLLNPTPFIQSTHNTVAGAIALAVKCHGYNATYTQRGHSFESAIQDALLQLNDDPSLNILVGGFDEVTPTSFELTSRLGLWKTHAVDNRRLYDYHTRGSFAGEGSSFMMLGGRTDKGTNICLKAMTSFYEDSIQDINEALLKFLMNKGIDPSNIGLVILGMNGDIRTGHYYDQLIKGIFRKHAVTAYKHLCGEYDTAVSFALWLAWFILKNHMPALPMLNSSVLGDVNSVLIYNQIRGKYHSVYYLGKC